MRVHLKVGLLVAAIIGTVVWLAAGGVREGGTYYKTVDELLQMGPEAKGKRLRVAGHVQAGSIKRSPGRIEFVLEQQNERLNVVYEGTDPLPDTFRDGVQAIADGRMTQDGVFRASRIQAKCASRYEASPAAHPKGLAKKNL